MYRFSDKKNREDVIALRWPEACLSCGVDMAEEADSRYAIVGMFHVDRKTTRGDRRHTQVLVKMPGYFYMCQECSGVIDSAFDNPPKNLEKLVETLRESPWMVFFELEKTGRIKLPDGLFKDKLNNLNPDARFKKKDNPLVGLKKKLGGG